MGPGPINAHPRVLQAMAAPLLGQFDPQFREYMKQTSALYRGVFQTANRWTLLVDGTARAGIEAALVSLIEPGDRVLVPVFGRFGNLLVEIAKRCGADVRAVEVEWGRVFSDDVSCIGNHEAQAESRCGLPRRHLHDDGAAARSARQDVQRARCPALRRRDRHARRHGPAGRPWQLDVVSAGLQKCLGGPPGSAPLTLNERAEKRISSRKHTEEGLKAPGQKDGDGPVIQSNYFDLAMIMDYWSDKALNHHTEATSMLYAARECARVLLQEGLPNAFARHARASRALSEGLKAMGLELFGDQAHKMPNVTGVFIPQGVDGDKVRSALLAEHNIEIGTSFGPLHGRIWRIGTMGYNAREDAVLATLRGLEAALAAQKFRLPRGAAVDAARAVYR